MTCPDVAVIGVPSNAGARSVGLERAPSALRAAGLMGRFRDAGVRAIDHDDLPEVVVARDLDHPREQNREAVIGVARLVAERVRAAVAAGLFPLVLGGDCTVTLGAVAGLTAPDAGLGVFYFDGDLDLNTPATTSSGIFDGMVAAHLLGEGAIGLARLGTRHPLVAEEHLTFFAFNVGAGFVDPPELAAVVERRCPRYPVEQVAADPRSAAREAVAHLEASVGRFLLHYDVDATDLPAADLCHPGALPWAVARSVLEIVAASPACAGLVLAELNPLNDPSGRSAQLVADTLAHILAKR